MPTLQLTWKTALDDLVCPICRPLEGRVWSFPSTKDIPAALSADSRTVWNMASHSSLTHEGLGSDCRCGLHVGVDFADLLAFVRGIKVWD